MLVASDEVHSKTYSLLDEGTSYSYRSRSEHNYCEELPIKKLAKITVTCRCAYILGNLVKDQSELFELDM